VPTVEYRPPQLDPFSPVLGQLREILKQMGYLTAGIAPTFQTLEPEISGVAPGSPLHTMLRLFFSQEPVEEAALREALQFLTLEDLLEAGFCRVEGELIHSNVLLQPYDDKLFALGQFSLDPSREELLMKISTSSLDLANFMIPHSSRNALDLGTGCGVLATLLSPNSERVYAVDLSSTAVQFADFNARWNGLSNVTCLQGSLFAPVRDLRFDHIISNPPFMICPVPASTANHLLFQHSGSEGDSFCIQLARDASTFLEEGGFFQMMFSWLEFAGQDWNDKLNAAFSGLGCDAWCLRVIQEPGEEYVSTWCSELTHVEQTDMESLRQQGLDYFKQNNIAAVGTGLLTLHRCSTRSNHLWFDEAPEDRSEPYGSSVASIFDVRVALDSVGNEVLLQHRFKAGPDFVSIQKSSLQKGQWQTTALEFGRESGLKYTFSDVDPFLVRVVPHLDGRNTLHYVLESLSREERVPLAEVIAKHLPSLREMLRFGFILPTK
jgi:methyltransferase family protein